MHPELRDKHTHKAHRGCQTAQGDTDELLGLPPLPTHAALSLVRSSHECSIPCGLLINARPGLRLHLSLTSRKPLLPAPCLHPQVAGSRFLTRPRRHRKDACLPLAMPTALGPSIFLRHLQVPGAPQTPPGGGATGDEGD